MNYIDRRYYESWIDNQSVIWQYLDCIEKIAYHQFQGSSMIMEEVFCDDINICLVEKEDTLELKRNCIKASDQYFEQIWENNLRDPEQYIKDMLDKGIIVGINTYFYDIPNFTWYKKERLEILCMYV